MKLEWVEPKLFNNFFENLPGSVYWKDRNGIYLDCNNYLKNKTANQGRIGPVKGGTDYLAFSKDLADEITENDHQVMKLNRNIIKQENIILPDESILSFLSSKKPCIDENGNLSGVLGISIEITSIVNSKNIFGIIQSLAESASKIKLTARQADCAYYLCRGKTNLEIARVLNISPRTVEDYIKQLKVKFGCFKRSALIEILLSSGINNEFKNR